MKLKDCAAPSDGDGAVIVVRRRRRRRRRRGRRPSPIDRVCQNVLKIMSLSSGEDEGRGGRRREEERIGGEERREEEGGGKRIPYIIAKYVVISICFV